MSEWIPVTDRRPDNYHPVLVSTDAGVCMAWPTFDGCWIGARGPLGDKLPMTGHHITHWMPLPEPATPQEPSA